MLADIEDVFVHPNGMQVACHRRETGAVPVRSFHTGYQNLGTRRDAIFGVPGRTQPQVVVFGHRCNLPHRILARAGEAS